jgi:hypothetical protein
LRKSGVSITAVVAAFQQEFPSTLLNFEVESRAVVDSEPHMVVGPPTGNSIGRAARL